VYSKICLELRRLYQRRPSRNHLEQNLVGIPVILKDKETLEDLEVEDKPPF